MSDYLLLEDGGYLLQENESKIIIYSFVPTPTAAPKKISAAWFAVPKLKEKIIRPPVRKVYINEFINTLK